MKRRSSQNASLVAREEKTENSSHEIRDTNDEIRFSSTGDESTDGGLFQHPARRQAHHKELSELNLTRR